jgi:hypothetical protein
MNAMGMNFKVWLGVALALSGAIINTGAQLARPPQGKPIEFSSPTSSQTMTNLSGLNGLSRRQQRLRAFEQAISGTPGLISLQGALDGAPSPVVPIMRRRPLPSKDGQDSVLGLDPEWMLFNSDTLSGNSDSGDSTDNTGDNQSTRHKQPLTSADLIYLELHRQDPNAFGKNSPMANDNSFGNSSPLPSDASNNQNAQRPNRDQAGDNSDSLNDIQSDPDLPDNLKGVRELRRALGGITGTRPDSVNGGVGTPGQDSFSDLFGLGQKPASPTAAFDQKVAHQIYMDEFRKISGIPKSLLGPADLSDPVKDSAKALSPFSGLSGLYSSGLSTGSTQPPPLSGLNPPPSLPAPELRSLSAPSVLPSLSKPAPALRPVQPIPTFSVPRPAF